MWSRFATGWLYDQEVVDAHEQSSLEGSRLLSESDLKQQNRTLKGFIDHSRKFLELSVQDTKDYTWLSQLFVCMDNAVRQIWGQVLGEGFVRYKPSVLFGVQKDMVGQIVHADIVGDGIELVSAIFSPTHPFAIDVWDKDCDSISRVPVGVWKLASFTGHCWHAGSTLRADEVLGEMPTWRIHAHYVSKSATKKLTKAKVSDGASVFSLDGKSVALDLENKKRLLALFVHNMNLDANGSLRG